MKTHRSHAMEIAAQCWCDKEVAGVEMDARLAKAFAKRIAVLLETTEVVLGLVAWMSGADDFAPGGTAHKGWLRTQRSVRRVTQALVNAQFPKRKKGAGS